MRRSALIALCVVLVLAVAAYYWQQRPKFTHTVEKLWSADAGSEYTCSGSAAGGWCIVPANQAAALCLDDKNCAGYVVPGATNTSQWTKDFAGKAQLFKKLANNTSDNAAFPNDVYRKISSA